MSPLRGFEATKNDKTFTTTHHKVRSTGILVDSIHHDQPQGA